MPFRSQACDSASYGRSFDSLEAMDYFWRHNLSDARRRSL